MGWKQKNIEHPKLGLIIELRNTYSRDGVLPIVALGKPSRIHQDVTDFGQILVKVTRDTVRLSMNGPCNMLPTQWATMQEWIESAQEEIREYDRDGAQAGR